MKEDGASSRQVDGHAMCVADRDVLDLVLELDALAVLVDGAVLVGR
jgi:hypothetical protein